MRVFCTILFFLFSTFLLNAQLSPSNLFLSSNLNFQRSVEESIQLIDPNSPSTTIQGRNTRYNFSISNNIGYQFNSKLALGLGVDFDLLRTISKYERACFSIPGQLPCQNNISDSYSESHRSLYVNLFGQYQLKLFSKLYWRPRFALGFLQSRQQNERDANNPTGPVSTNSSNWYQNYIRTVIEQELAYFIKDNIGLVISLNRINAQFHVYDSRYNDSNQPNGTAEFGFSSNLKDFRLGAIFIFGRKNKE